MKKVSRRAARRSPSCAVKMTLIKATTVNSIYTLINKQNSSLVTEDLKASGQTISYLLNQWRLNLESKVICLRGNAKEMDGKENTRENSGGRRRWSECGKLASLDGGRGGGGGGRRGGAAPAPPSLTA
ncbi:hypothetical protein EVAR_89549_1 [Eumeta japonica]|uniref:Uncharacterized protein n=1 Tax=Eumeta variegata TaxID=151549 RepID=A0A4C1Z7K6_EUMVA|nr:hypothetical protein EVAR_89549_1 [Eumeta japonica]